MVSLLFTGGVTKKPSVTISSSPLFPRRFLHAVLSQLLRKLAPAWESPCESHLPQGFVSTGLFVNCNIVSCKIFDKLKI